jgi:hypothetical protein
MSRAISSVDVVKQATRKLEIMDGGGQCGRIFWTLRVGFGSHITFSGGTKWIIIIAVRYHGTIVACLDIKCKGQLKRTYTSSEKISPLVTSIST